MSDNLWLGLMCANDNAPNDLDPRNYEDFDPATMPDDYFFDDDTPLDVCAFMSRYA